MTIASQDARSGPYNGNGSTTVFAYDFKALSQTDLVVTLKNSAGVETVQTLTTNYSVSGVGVEGGGNVTMVTAPASGETLTITRSVPVTQGVDLQNRGGVQPSTLETAYDRLTQISQDTREVQDRAVKFPVSSALSGIEMPGTATSNATISWNSDGTALINGPTASQISSAETYATNASNSASAAAVSESNAGTSETNAAASYDAFDDRYLGSKSSAPSVDNDGNTLLDGALYWNTTDNNMYVYNLGGTAWVTVSNTVASSAAASSASAAATSASNASTSETNASNSASAASTSETNADTAKDAAIVAQAAAEAALDEFTDTYLGAKSSDPTVDNDGNALTTGDQYFNTVDNVLKIWNGSSWQAAALSADSFVSKTSGTGSAGIPVGTTAQRDGSPATGYFRYNSTETQFEGYDGSAWGQIGGGAGYFKGDNGTVGSSPGDIFRINEAELNANVTIAATENASATGPVGVASGVTLTVDGVLVIL